MNIDMGAVLTLCLFMVGHLCGTVWWMSKVNATLGFIGTQISEILKTVATHEASFVKATEHAKDIGRLEKSLDAVWEKLDHPHACPNHKDSNG